MSKRIYLAGPEVFLRDPQIVFEAKKEICRQYDFEGVSPLESHLDLKVRAAAIEASRLRLRPILMTSLAFILGVLPLVVAEGAGAEKRRTLGLAVFSGMLGVTLFGIFLTPVFFYSLLRGSGLGKAKQPVSSRIA